VQQGVDVVTRVSSIEPAGGDSFATWVDAMAFESLLTYSRFQVEPKADRQKSRESLGFVMNGLAGDVYNEEAFRHFLMLERTRADRSQRNFLLLLVSLRLCPKSGVQVSRALSGPLFAGLHECVREVDFIGWYQEQRVAGAVLTQGLDIPRADAVPRIIHRVSSILSKRLPSDADRLRIRVVQLGPKGIS
jgi:hypothetical protein